MTTPHRHADRRTRIALALMLGAVVGGAHAGAIGTDAPSTLAVPEAVSPLDFNGLAPVAPGPQALVVAPARKRVASRAELDELLQSMDIPRPEFVDEEHWYRAADETPEAIAPETLLRDVGTEVWLSEQSTARRSVGAMGISDTLRSLVNVYSEPTVEDFGTQAVASAPAPVAGRTGGGGGSVTADLLRNLLVAAIEPHRRADGRVGFSVFGFGEFVAEVDRNLRTLRFHEETTGWSASLSRGGAGPRPEQALAPRDATLGSTAVAPRIAGPVAPIAVPEIRIFDLVGDAFTWAKESVLLRVLAVLWVLAMVVRAVVSLDRGLRSRRRNRIGRPVLAAAAPAAAAPLAATVPTSDELPARRPVHARRARPRRTRSPSLRNLLRSFGLGG